MKIIDLLNKIANGEEVPKVIYFWERPYYFNKEYECYMYQCDGNKFIDLLDNHNDNLNCFLNDEVEIAEEDKKIEKLNYNNNDEFDIEGFTFDYEQKMQIVDKINEIIDHMNKGDK